MLLPKRVKYRRVMRGRMKGKATRGNVVSHGEFGLQALEPAWITSRQIEAARIAMTRYTKRGGKEYIKFEEVYDGADQKSVSLIKISDDCVEVSRKGAITTCMEFVKNKKTVSCYNTPYGSINISIFTSVLMIERQEDTIHILLEYTMEVNDQQMNTNRVEMEITNERVELYEV